MQFLRRVILASVPSLLLLACGGGNNKALVTELQTERALLVETRTELQEIIKKLEPVLALAKLLDGNLELLNGLAGEESESGESGEVIPNPFARQDNDPGRGAAEEHSSRITRAALDKNLGDMAGLSKGARIVPSIKDGAANGFKLYAIRPTSFFATLGFMNGDTVHRLNGMELSSPDKALEAYTKLQSASVVKIELTRRGKPHLLTITID